MPDIVHNIFSGLGFFLGISTYLFFLSQQHKKMMEWFFIMLIISVITSFLLSWIGGFSLSLVLYISAVLLMILFGGWFWRDLMPSVTEMHVISYTVLFWFLYFQFLEPIIPSFFQLWIIVFGILFSLMSLWGAFGEMDSEWGWRLLLTFWYIVVNVLIVLVSVQGIFITDHFFSQYVLGVVSILCGRNIFCMVIAHPLLRQLISVKVDGESVSLLEDADDIIIRQFDPLDLPIWSVLVFLLIEILLLYGNMVFHLIDGLLMINSLAVVIPVSIQIVSLWVDAHIAAE